MIIGLSGKLGSGKDTVYQRIKELYPEYDVKRLAFADKLKESAAAALGVPVEWLEEIKRNDDAYIEVASGNTATELTVRKYLQNYGLEAHRNVFGENFWVDQLMGQITINEWSEITNEITPEKQPIYIITDVRFDNEAHAIKLRNGQVWEIIGIEEDTGDHPSEQPLDPSLISGIIYNNCRHLNTDLTIDYTCVDSDIKECMDAIIGGV